ncbi:hypothetical protein ASD64_07965 [Mesorhizobium sp. Root157]|nr:hypothetical protein ASD64_07965 [Mesorhizobium sp. Root157]
MRLNRSTQIQGWSIFVAWLNAVFSRGTADNVFEDVGMTLPKIGKKLLDRVKTRLQDCGHCFCA